MMDTPLEERLRAYLNSPDYEPQDRSGIARGMAVSSAERAELRGLLARWEAEKKLLRLRGARFAPAEVAQRSYTGCVRVLPHGKKLFVPHDEGQRALACLVEQEQLIQVDIAPGRSMGAMEGDVVRARVLRAVPHRHRRKKDGGRRMDAVMLRAQVEAVLERKRDVWVGIYSVQGRRAYVRGDGRTAPARIAISAPSPPETLVGMLVVVQPESCADGQGEARGRIVETLGWPEDDGVDMAALIHRYGLSSAFSEEALAETLQLPQTPSAAAMRGREDWRRRCVVTIDPPDARDFDDAISVSRCEQGWELAVHIADVSHYVQPGSALDAEARRRGNSTYLPDRVLPMLPPRLCDDLCSLVQGEPRLTALCHMVISPTGEVVEARLARAVICSRRRLAYPAVLALLEEGKSVGDAEVDAMLLEAHNMAQALRRRRFETGALNLDMPELRALLDERGRTVGFAKEQSDLSHQLIEECMLAANEQVAKLLRARELPSIYRVHEQPAAEKWSDLAHALREYGITASVLVSRKELVHVLQRIAGRPDEARLKTLILRAMMRARYAARPLGHFGLAKENYCHFTSPIRRYADLVVHRSVARIVEPHASLPFSPGHMARLAEHLSETERQSAAAEAEALRLKLLQYMDAQSRAESPRAWLAYVGGVWSHGLALEVEELLLRGYLPSAHLPRRRGWGYSGGRWVSPDGKRLEEGASLWVVPASVDWERQMVDFRPAEAEPPCDG